MDIPLGFEDDILLAQQLEIQRSKDPQIIASLIAVYEQILDRLLYDESPMFYAAIQNNRGVAYGDLLTGNREASLTKAIACYQEALRFRTPETAPLQYARTQNNLGNAYRDLLTGNREANLTKAIACYQEALRFWTPETSTFEYATVQNNLGVTYSDLLMGDREANLTKAIACYQEALRFRTPETAPLQYARTQNNLGNAYRDLSTGNREANLMKAIACYQEALRFRTIEMMPLQYATTQNNLGVAYSHLPTGDREMNLTKAIACYQEALRFRTPEISPLDYAMTQNNLGNVYSHLRTGDREANLMKAIACYQEALRFRTIEMMPLQYATTQNNLGVAYSHLPTGDREMNLTKAIACFQEALRVWTLETAPFDYAMVQHNMGFTYSSLSMEDREANLTRAIACYQEALRVWTPETAPFECRMTNRNLANLHFTRKEWAVALKAYKAAMEAGERLYRAGLSEESKQTEVVENNTLYHNAAFTALRCGGNMEALLILERGKTRLLAEALRLRIPRPANVPDEVWNEFEMAGAAVRASQYRGTAELDREYDRIQSYSLREQAMRAASVRLNGAIERVKAFAPEFLQEINIPALQSQLLDKSAVISAFCITEQGSVGFVLSANQDIRAVEVPDFTRTNLLHLAGEWLKVYRDYRNEHTQAALNKWQVTIANALTELARSLLTPILLTLSSNVEQIIFLPSAELFLLPLHAVPLSDSATDRVCDRYKVRYTPSIEVLVNVHTRAIDAAPSDLYAIISPQEAPGLTFASIEEAAIVPFFARSTLDRGKDGSKQRMIARVQGRSYVHFLCHASYNWSEPSTSGLDLADGRLTLAELRQGVVDLSAARLVTLSACETGMIDVTRGNAEEYMGVPAGFLLVGVPCVLGSLWEVPDFSTSLLMMRFYQNHLMNKMDIAEALRKAQVWVRELGVGEVAQYTEQWYRQAQQKEKLELFKLMRYYRQQEKQNAGLHPFDHPYYWAAFTVNGL